MLNHHADEILQVGAIEVVPFGYGAGPWAGFFGSLPAGRPRSSQPPCYRAHVFYHPSVPGEQGHCAA